VVVEVGAEMVSGVPVPTSVPPQEPLYHFRAMPDPPVAVRAMLAKAPLQKLL